MFGNKKQTQATVRSMNAKLIALLNWGMGVFHMRDISLCDLLQIPLKHGFVLCIGSVLIFNSWNTDITTLDSYVKLEFSSDYTLHQEHLSVSQL